MKERNAYFTVEAALVFPVVISVLLFVVYMLLFQYDRCLLEQDLGGIAMYGSILEDTDTGALEQKAARRISELYREKYAAWRITALDASFGQNKFSVQGSGQLTFPMPGWNLWSHENVWGTTADYSYSRLSPVTFIRLCHKFEKVAER